MIHGGHGNLIGQVYVSLHQHANDWYGGSFEKQDAFPAQIMEAIAREGGQPHRDRNDASGATKLSNGMHLDEVLKFLPMAQKYIDLVNISRGLIVDHNYHFYTQPPYYNEYCHNVKYAREVKKVLDIPVSVVGSIKTLKDSQEIISSGAADVVAMCRQLMADPDTIKKSKAGKEDEIRPACAACKSATKCGRGQPVR